jgi:hypothetical protein
MVVEGTTPIVVTLATEALFGARCPLKTLLGNCRKMVSSVPLPVTKAEGLGSFKVGHWTVG